MITGDKRLLSTNVAIFIGLVVTWDQSIVLLADQSSELSDRQYHGALTPTQRPREARVNNEEAARLEGGGVSHGKAVFYHSGVRQ